MSRTVAGRAACAFALVSLFVFSALVARGVGEPPAAPADKPAQPEAAKSQPPVSKTAAPATNPVETPVERALSSSAAWLEFDGTPLKDVMDTIAARHKINILFDTKALTDAGASPDDPITIKLKGVSLRSALRLMLSAKDLKYVLPEGTSNTLLITSSEVAKNHLKVRVYNIRDFARPASDLPNKPAGEYDELIDVLNSTIAPASWEGAGGAGSLDSLAGKLVVSQTDEVHEQVTNLLSMLEIAKQRQQTKLGGDPIETSGAAEAKITKALESTTDLDFNGAPLQNVIDALHQRNGIEIQIDTKALTDAGCSPDDPITFHIKGVTLRAALRLMLSAKDLNYYIDHEVLLITSAEVEKNKLYTKVYPVGDLIQSIREATAIDLDGAYEQLTGVLTETVAPTAWSSAGGPGDLRASVASKSIVILQSFEVHEAICRMLAKLRSDFAEAKPADPAEAHSDAAMISYVYRLPYTSKGPSDLADRYVVSIKTFVDPESWSDSRFAIQAFPDRIVVRQTPATQFRVEQFLVKLGAIDPPGVTTLSGAALSAARARNGGRLPPTKVQQAPALAEPPPATAKAPVPVPRDSPSQKPASSK